MWPTIGSNNKRWPFLSFCIWIGRPLQQITSLLSDLCNVGQLCVPFSFRLSPSSTWASDGQFSFPQRVFPLQAPLLVRLLQVLLSQYLPSRVSALTVCSYGAPRSLSVVRSSGVCWTRPFIVLWQFPCWAPSLLAAVVSPCPRFLRGFCGSSLSLAVLAGLLPQLTTYDHCFTFTSFQATPLNSHSHMLNATFHQVQAAEHTCRK